MIRKTLQQFFTDEFISHTEILDDIIIPSKETPHEENTPPSPNQNIDSVIKESQNTEEESLTMAKEPTIVAQPTPPEHPELLKLFQECLACKACELCDSALNLVFGDGNPQAKIMLIGEAPGADEDEQAKPFVGRAGQLLIGILNKYGVQREDIFIANILKHRPPSNRNPLPAEIQACTPFLRKQIEIIQPQLLITLGNFSSQFILDTKVGITKIRGTIQESSFGKVMPSLHPSAIIRGAYPKHLLEGDVVTALQFVGYDVEYKED